MNKYLITNNKGSSILLSMGLVAMLAAATVSMSTYFNNKYAKQTSISQEIDAKVIAQDIQGILSDPTNCGLSLNGVVGGALTAPSYRMSNNPTTWYSVSKITNEITNARGRIILNSAGTSLVHDTRAGKNILYDKVEPYNGIKISDMYLGNLRQKVVTPPLPAVPYVDPFTYTGLFHVKFQKSGPGFGPKKFAVEFEIEVNTNKTAGADFKKFKDCRSSGEVFDAGTTTTTSTIPNNCPDGALLSMVSGQYKCSTDVGNNYTTVKNITRRVMPCQNNHARQGSSKAWGQKCATYNVSKYNFGTNGTGLFLNVGTPGTVLPLPKPDAANRGATIDTFNYTATSKSKISLHAYVPIFFSEGGTISGGRRISTYDAAFIGFIFYRNVSVGGGWILAGSQDIWNPASSPGGGNVRANMVSSGHADGLRTYEVPHRGKDMGGTGMINAEFNANAGNTYQIAFQLVSPGFFSPGWYSWDLTSIAGPNASARPDLIVGTMKFDHIFAEGSYIITEYLRK